MRKVPDINEMGAEERVLISDEGIIVYNPANVMPPSVAMPPRRDRRWPVTLGSQRKPLHTSVERSYEVRRHLIHSTPDLTKKTRSLEHVATDPSIIDRLFGTSAPRTLRQSVAEQILSRSFKPTIVDEDATEAKVRNAVAEDGGLNINMYSLSQTQLANSLSIASNMDQLRKRHLSAIGEEQQQQPLDQEGPAKEEEKKQTKCFNLLSEEDSEVDSEDEVKGGARRRPRVRGQSKLLQSPDREEEESSIVAVSEEGDGVFAHDDSDPSDVAVIGSQTKEEN